LKDDICSKEISIEYPCSWRYKLIVIAKSDIKTITKRVLKNREHTINFSHESKNGGYKSYNLDILVFNGKDREELFEALKADSDIKFIL
jgi:putative lipoic acid-binding regulatory protein